jgi:hypothetical protein
MRLDLREKRVCARGPDLRDHPCRRRDAARSGSDGACAHGRRDERDEDGREGRREDERVPAWSECPHALKLGDVGDATRTIS